MKLKRKNIMVTKERAIQITMNHNGVSRETAERYTDSELKEVLASASGRTYKLIADF